MRVLLGLFENHPLMAATAAWIAAQVSKTLIMSLFAGRFCPERLVGAGGMPSSHSAMVSALTIAVARKAGLQSVEFAITFVLASIVIYDAMGVRRAAGDQAKVLNRLLFGHSRTVQEACEDADANAETGESSAEELRSISVGEFFKIELPEKELKEFLGHTPIEVLGGVLLGILIAMVIPN